MLAQLAGAVMRYVLLPTDSIGNLSAQSRLLEALNPISVLSLFSLLSLSLSLCLSVSLSVHLPWN